MNETANATLAIGALPVMAHAREEVEEMVGLAGALVLNIGTLSPQWIEAMLAAGAAAEIPIVLDPVGAGATEFRTETAHRILDTVNVTVLLVFGASDPKAGACGSLFSIPSDRRLHHQAEVLRGILESECASILKDFFAQKRQNGPTCI